MTDATGTPVYGADYSPYGETLAQSGSATSNLSFIGERATKWRTDKSGLFKCLDS